jgi:hypothetical protein
MPRVIHFDISANDPERALRFYRDVFGWKTEKWKGPFNYWFIKTGEPNQPGIDGGLAKRAQPWESITNIIDVTSVDEIAARIVAKGGMIIQPRHAIPGVSYLIACKDTEGNVFGVMQMDESAA